MISVKLERRGNSRTFYGFDPLKRLCVEVGFHHGRKELFLDIEDVITGKRIFFETATSLNYLLYRGTAAVSLHTLDKLELQVPENITQELMKGIVCH
jgi:hypothetical protein